MRMSKPHEHCEYSFVTVTACHPVYAYLGKDAAGVVFGRAMRNI
jgi:hypothetical protein